MYLVDFGGISIANEGDLDPRGPSPASLTLIDAVWVGVLHIGWLVDEAEACDEEGGG